MKLTTRLLALLLALVMLLPMAAACSEPAVENNPVKDKDPVAGELAPVPEAEEKVDAKALLLELLKEAELDANSATVKAKFKGQINVSFLDPEMSYNTDDLVDYVDDDGYINIPVSDIIDMFSGDNEILGDMRAIYKDLLIEFVMGGDYASLEEMLGGVVDSFDLEVITSQYGSVENYLSAILAAQLIGAVLTANEYAAHMNAGAIESFESCADEIKYMVSNLTNYILTEIKGENDLYDVLYFLYNEDYLGLLARGCVCYINGEDKESINEADYALASIITAIENNDALYDGEGNYNLEVYYPAIADNIEPIFEAFIYTYGYRYNLDYDYAVDALVEYLGTEDGPVANLDVCDILLSIGAAALATVYTNEMLYESDFEGSEPEFAFFNLSEEKWYVVDTAASEPTFVPLTDGTNITVFDEYGIQGYMYVSPYGYEFASTFEEAYALCSEPESICAMYAVHVGDEPFVDYEDTVNAVYDELFELLTGGIGAEMTEDDQLMVAAAMLAFTMTYPEQNGEKLMDEAFAESFIISALSASVLDGAYETFTDVAVMLGYDKKPEAPEANVVYAEDFVDKWIVKVVADENVATEDYLIAMIVEVLANDYVAGALDSWYGLDNFSGITAAYIAAKYLGDGDASEIFGDEELGDGLPVTVVAAILSEYVFLNVKDYKYRDVTTFILGYYDYSRLDIVNYEDIIALYIAIEDRRLYDIDNYRYPFDYIEHMVMLGLLDSVMSEKFYDENAADNSDYYTASAAAMNLLNKIYLVDGDDSLNTSDVLVDFMWVLLATDLGDKELSDMMDTFKGAVNTAMEADSVDLKTCSAQEALMYIFGTLYTEVAPNSDRYIDYLFAKLLPAQTEDARIALADTIGGLIEEASVGFEDIKTLDKDVLVFFLSNVSVILSENGMDTTVLDGVVDAIEALNTELDIEKLLDMIFAESFDDEAYTVLTDVVLALMGGSAEDALTAIDAAKTALAEDLIAVGYLRALEASISGAQPDMDGTLNVIALMYLAKYHGEDVSAVIVPALYMSLDEFKAYFKFEQHYPDVYTVRAWADKYIALYNENGTVNVLEMAVDFLVASGYYEEEEIPAATDALYYEKLAAIYAANEYFCNEEYADAVVDVIFNPDNIYLYGDDFLAIADSIDMNTENKAEGIAKLLFYVMSTKAYLAVEDARTVDWDKALAYIPVYYSIFTKSEEPLEIANNAAFAELLRPVFADTVNAAFEATVVPYETANEVIYVFTVVGDIEHVAVDGECEMIIEIRVPKAA